MKKTGLAVLAVMAIVSCGIAQKYDYDDESDFRIASLGDGNSAAIIEYVGNKQIVRIPPKLQGMRVTTIGSRAFDNNQLTDVSIPNSVTRIEWGAFMDNLLTDVTIPEGVTSIRSNAFSNNQLTEISLPNSVTDIGMYAFSNNQLTEITVPANVTEIGRWAFSNNPLTKFTVAQDNKVYRSQDNFLLSGDIVSQLIDYYGSEKNIVIPNGVANIWSQAFQNKQLTNVTFPDYNLMRIGNDAFENNQLTSIVIPAKTVIRIESGAFYNNQLTKIVIGANVMLGYGRFNFYNDCRGRFDNGFGSGIECNANGFLTSGIYVLNSDGKWERKDKNEGESSIKILIVVISAAILICAIFGRKYIVKRRKEKVL
jgi:hypothetical protein